VVRDQMDIEDEITDELNNMSRVIEQQKEILIEAEITLEQNKTALEEKEKQIQELRKRLASTS
jgi:xanthine dehydrogenase iron-sulfur cluster and FAD-binding subunit A